MKKRRDFATDGTRIKTEETRALWPGPDDIVDCGSVRQAVPDEVRQWSVGLFVGHSLTYEEGFVMLGFHPNRREFLAGVAGCTLSFALPALSAKGAEERGPARAKSLILVWLEGGASQLETWDPHPGSKVGGPTRRSTRMCRVCRSLRRIRCWLRRSGICR